MRYGWKLCECRGFEPHREHILVFGFFFWIGVILLLIGDCGRAVDDDDKWNGGEGGWIGKFPHVERLSSLEVSEQSQLLIVLRIWRVALGSAIYYMGGG